MINFVADAAKQSGAPLTDDERSILAAENPDVAPATEKRLRGLVAKVIAEQKQTGQENERKSFVNAIEWAGDGEYPYVVALAEAEITESQSIDRVIRREYPISPLLATIGCLVLVLLAIGIVVLVVDKLIRR